MSSLVSGAGGSDGVGGGEAEPQAKRQPKTDNGPPALPDVDGPIEDDETARHKLKEAGFDPEKPAEEVYLNGFISSNCGYWITPMTYFSHHGDLKMCRYLYYVKGVDTTYGRSPFFFPLYVAALGGRLDVCKWLYDHGSGVDIRRHNNAGHSPLSVAVGRCHDASNIENREVYRWLILNGAVHGDFRDIDTAILTKDLTPWVRSKGGARFDERPRVLSWAKGVLQVHDGFQAFLMGTLAPPENSKSSLGSMRHRYRTRYQSRYESPIQSISGNPGVLELISGFVGIYRGKKISIFRQLVESLSPLVNDASVGQGL